MGDYAYAKKRKLHQLVKFSKNEVTFIHKLFGIASYTIIEHPM